MRLRFAACHHLVCLALLLAAVTPPLTRAAEPAPLPATFLLRPGQQVLLLGDSIIGPGMYAHALNGLLDRLHPESGIAFHSFGVAMATCETILPRVPEALAGKTYDWVLINFGHNDSGRMAPEAFATTHAPALLAAVRQHHRGAIGWLSTLGSEPSPWAGEAQRARDERITASRAKQAALAEALRGVCERHDARYLGLHEAMAGVLASRARQELRVAFTMDSSHPTTLGNWVAAGLILQLLGLRPPPTTVDLLQAEAFADQSLRPGEPLAEPLTLTFDGLFLQPRLLPPPTRELTVMTTPRPLTVDGDGADWPEAPATHLAAPLQVTWELVPRLAAAGRHGATLRLARDATQLYLLCEVRTPETGPAQWFPEIIEFIVDARRERERERSGNVWRRTPGLTQFVFHRDFSGDQPGGVKASANGDASQGEGVRAAARRSATGYVVEAAIPLANFKQVDLTAGATVPVNWAISFNDQVLNLDWQGLMSRSQNTFGYGLLKVPPAPAE